MLEPDVWRCLNQPRAISGGPSNYIVGQSSLTFHRCGVKHTFIVGELVFVCMISDILIRPLPLVSRPPYLTPTAPHADRYACMDVYGWNLRLTDDVHEFSVSPTHFQ